MRTADPFPLSRKQKLSGYIPPSALFRQWRAQTFGGSRFEVAESACLHQARVVLLLLELGADVIEGHESRGPVNVSVGRRWEGLLVHLISANHPDC